LASLAVILLAMPASRAVKGLALVLFLPLLLPTAPGQDGTDLATRVTVLDVGQGTAVVIQAGPRVLLYDTGGGDPAGATMATAVVLPYLRARGVNALDTFVISHPDRDHSAGAAAVLQAVPVQRLRFGDRPPGVEGGRLCIAGQAWRWPGGQHFQFLSPAQEQGLSRNDRSCVLQVRLGDYRLLLPGDIENARERDLVRYWREGLRSDWLLLAHHGSATSSSPALLKTVQPRTVVINSGYANRFGHPHPDVMRRVRSRGLDVYATADGGALEFEFHPDREPIVNVYRRQRRRFWM
jgi:competence protein ComEC